MNKPLFKTGLIGTALTAVCCFTPLLVVGFGAVGLAAVVGWLDYVLLPLLALFVGITLYALLTRRNEEDQPENPS